MSQGKDLDYAMIGGIFIVGFVIGMIAHKYGAPMFNKNKEVADSKKQGVLPKKT